MPAVPGEVGIHRTSLFSGYMRQFSRIIQYDGRNAANLPNKIPREGDMGKSVCIINSWAAMREDPR